MNKNILIIGGTNFIGPYVVRKLAGLGHQVTVYHRGEHKPQFTAAIRHICCPEAAMPVTKFVDQLFKPVPDVVIHMIAMGEADSVAAVNAFRGLANRMVWLSSGDVYRAYGRFTEMEPGIIDNHLLTEDSPLRTIFFPYRKNSSSVDELNYYYEKILVEQAAFSCNDLPGVVLRLPKVYGAGNNADLATVYQFAHHPDWRWTHGYVENVAEAVILAALHPAAVNQLYNVGEMYTPTVAERLSYLPPSLIPPAINFHANFSQDIAYDTSKIRTQLGYREHVAEIEAMQESVKTTLL